MARQIELGAYVSITEGPGQHYADINCDFKVGEAYNEVKAGAHRGWWWSLEYDE